MKGGKVSLSNKRALLTYIYRAIGLYFIGEMWGKKVGSLDERAVCFARDVTVRETIPVARAHCR